MAEAAVENRPNPNRFYCHSCSQEISPKPDYTCPRCENGFIEEITEGFQETDAQTPSEPTVDPAAQFAELWGRAFLDSFQNQVSGSTAPTRERTEDSDSEEEERNHPQPHGLRPSRIRPFRISVRTGNRRPVNRHQQHIHGLLQMFVDRLTGEMGQPVNFMPIHGNPGDYAWGVSGLDNIITQLLNQLEGSGPAPADKTKIDSLPSVRVTQKQVSETIQCSICMEDFSLNEVVKKLPCEHHYHKDCIVPWLEMHGTCPVCRKDLNGIDASLKDDYPTPVDLMDSVTPDSASGGQDSVADEDDDD
ncbi:E3 ubiquitin-protein ligase RNF115-like [Pecten maximus]|uniref:E3 ubiquitin-protein ligase RNF115-like n=1 Tax=Pecten maximus TaxID=6579 RepID=UPI001457F624|nr:E3 ubiquitin-protein ligase RNF115-like [Pecten maximus]